MVKCPYCLNQTVTKVTFQNGYLSYIAAFFFLLAFGLLSSLLFIPVVMLLTKQLIHRYFCASLLFRCSVCSEEIGNDGKIFHTIGLKDSVTHH